MDEIEKLISSLESGKVQTRRDAAYLLGEKGDPRAIPGLNQALQDDDTYVRDRARDSLRKLDVAVADENFAIKMRETSQWWTEKSTNQKLLILLAFLIVGIFLTYSGVSQILLKEASKDWPTVEGQVIQSKVTFNGDYQDPIWRARVTVEYSSKGNSYSLRFGGICSTERSAKEVVDRYPRGSTVLVFYDPSSPSRAVPDAGNCYESFSPGWTLFFGVVSTLVGLALLYELVREEH